MELAGGKYLKRLRRYKMKKSKIVILRGMVSSGKTTALHNLRKNREMKDWIIINFNELKAQFKHLGDEKRKEYGKRSLFAILKILMQTKKNILFDEMSEEGVRKNITYYLKKYNYEIIVFEFTVNVEKAIKREAQRMIIRGLKPRGAKWVTSYHKDRLKIYGVNPKGIIVDTTHLNEKQVINLILKNLK